MAVVDELITILGLKSDASVDRESGKLTSALSGITKSAAIAGAALIAGAGAVSLWVRRVADGADAGKKFADSHGLVYESLQELEFAVDRSGGSVGELRSDLDRLTRTMASPIPGEFNQTLAVLGISARDAAGELKSADVILEDLADTFSELSTGEQLQLGEKLGLTASTIMLLQEGRGSIRDLRAEARGFGGIISSEDADKAAELNDRLTDLNAVIFGISSAIAVSLFPALTESLSSVRDFFFANRELISLGIGQFIEGISQGFGIFSGVVGSVVDAVRDLAKDILPATDSIDAVRAIAVVAAGVLFALALSALVAAAPFIAMGLAIAGVALIIEDLWVAMQGGESVIGGFFDEFENRFPALADAIKSLGKVFTDTFKLIGEGWTEIYKLITGNSLVGGITDALEFLDETAANYGFGGPDLAQVGPSVSGLSAGDRTIIHQNINGAGDPRAVGQEVVNRSGIAGSLQPVSPGFNRPVTN